MEAVYTSPLKDEMASYIDFVKLSIKDYKAYQRTLVDFDAFLCAEGLDEKRICAEQVSRWLDGFRVKAITKNSKLSHVRRFAAYLRTLGIEATVPETMRVRSDFTPYVFTTDEMARMFELADDIVVTNPKSRIAAEFPVLLRLLYGCGLRLGEAAALTWDDVSLETGVITVKAAKNKKQRYVPMGDELTRILCLYRKAACFDMDDHCPLFRKQDGSAQRGGVYWGTFNTILCELGIKNAQTAKYGERGPCIHSLRHTFTLRSLLQSEAAGRGFMETVPFLSTYLGHDGLMETDSYLKARHELYEAAHTTIADYTQDVFPEEV